MMIRFATEFRSQDGPRARHCHSTFQGEILIAADRWYLLLLPTRTQVPSPRFFPNQLQCGDLAMHRDAGS